MMIKLAILIKVSFVVTGRYGGLLLRRNVTRGTESSEMDFFIPIRKGLLKTFHLH